MNEVIEHKYQQQQQQQTNKEKHKKHLTFKADDKYLFSTKKKYQQILECKCQSAANINSKKKIQKNSNRS